MLNVGFADDVETILENLPQKRQTMMFSATMPSWIRKLTQKYLNNPLTIDLVGKSDQKLAEGITLYSIVSEMHERAAIIEPLVTEHAKGGKCIVFTQTKRDADRLAYALQKSFPCEALHGDISQNQKERTLSSFCNGQFNILVATDVATRGLDVPNVDLVIHYELPNSSEIFAHRSGWTGRAGKKGSAILIYSSNQFREVKGIERDVGCRFSEVVMVVTVVLKVVVLAGLPVAVLAGMAAHHMVAQVVLLGLQVTLVVMVVLKVVALAGLPVAILAGMAAHHMVAWVVLVGIQVDQVVDLADLAQAVQVVLVDQSLDVQSDFGNLRGSDRSSAFGEFGSGRSSDKVDADRSFGWKFF